MSLSLMITAILLLIVVIILLVIYFKNISTIRRQNSQLLELKQQQKKLYADLEVLVNDKDQILSTVSHDMKAPFNRIFALANLMQLDGNEQLNANQSEYLSIIQSVVSDGLLLIRNMMDMRSIDGKGIEMNVRKLNLVAILSSVVKNNKEYAAKKNISVEYEAPNNKIALISDKHYLERSIENVLSNAIKFSPHNAVVSIKVEDESEALTISIQDQGPGIIEDEIHLLFTRFGVLSSKPTGGESTNGLGLYITKSMIEKLGGEIQFDSKLGEGTTFKIILKKN